MLFFLRATNGSLVYLLKDRQYSVGRKLCDILIEDDHSISRKHAILTIKNDTVTVLDCGSRYNTFVDKTKIESGIEVPLNNGTVIRFGMLKSIYTLQGISIVTTTSSIKTEQKVSLRSNINFLGGSIVQNWTSQCTHVTVEEIMLTAKVLCAIIQGIPIVKVKYWDDYVNNAKQNLAPPDIASYIPKCSEVILSNNISLEYKEGRKELFKNKVFVFAHKSDKAKIADMIMLAGGEAVSWDANPLTRADLNDSSKQYILLQTSDSDTKTSSTLLDFSSCYGQMGKRTIPLQEIALAIVKCSCEKDCNPDFDRKGTVLATSTQNDFQKHTGNILAPPTQSMSLIPGENVKTEVIIPASGIMEHDLDITPIDKLGVAEEPVNSFIPNELNTQDIKASEPSEVEIPSSVKRESESIDHLKATKKIKLESAPHFTNATKPKRDITNTSELKSESVREGGEPSGRALFAFKKNKLSNEADSSCNENANPFSRKRKCVQSDNSENPPKKSASINDSSPVPSASFASPKSSTPKENPFTNILKSKNSTSLNSAKTSVFKSKSMPKATSTMINETNSLQVDISAIIVVDSNLENNYGWVSKVSNRTCNKESTINGDLSAADAGIIKYIESFRNTVVIADEKEQIIKKTSIDNNNDSSIVNNNTKNFKKFKKVQPLRLQTTIIPESTYVDVICNHNCAIEVVRPNSEDESDDGIDSQARTGKRSGKRYAF